MKSRMIPSSARITQMTLLFDTHGGDIADDKHRGCDQEDETMSETSAAVMRRGADRLLIEWNGIFWHDNARAVLNFWAQQPFAKLFESLTDDRSHHHALLDSFVGEIEPFDCLLIAGWQPAENQLSDVIAALFDSDWGHPFALPVLQHILRSVASKPFLAPLTRNAISRIQQSLGNCDKIFVRRERRGSASRADIDIYGHG